MKLVSFGRNEIFGHIWDDPFFYCMSQISSSCRPPPSLRSDLIVCLGSYFIVCSQQNKRNWEVDQPMKVGLSFIKRNSNQLKTQIKWELKLVGTKINWKLKLIENSNHWELKLIWTKISLELKSIKNSNQLRTPKQIRISVWGCVRNNAYLYFSPNHLFSAW